MNLSMILNSEKIILFAQSNKKMKIIESILKNKNSKYPLNILIKMLIKSYYFLMVIKLQGCNLKIFHEI